MWKDKVGEKHVNVFELDESVFKNKELNIKIFDKPSKEWAQFILNNRDRNFKFSDRNDCNTDNKYDIVVGPVADDDIIILFRTFVNGLISMDTLIKELELTDQYSFHTERALKYLKGV